MSEFSLDVARFVEQGAAPTDEPNIGKSYTKDDAGVTQLFYLASDGTEYQLTPPSPGGGGQIADFVYDTGAVQAGNVYNNFSDVVAACNALGCNCRVYVAVAGIDATLNAGAYDVSRIEFKNSGDAALAIIFTGATLQGSTMIDLDNVIFASGGGAPVIDTTDGINVVYRLRNRARLRGDTAPFFNLDAGTVQGYVHDVAALENNGSAVFEASFAVITSDVYFDRLQGTSGLCTANAGLQIYAPSGNVGNLSTFIGANDTLTYARAGQIRPAAFAASQNDYNPALLSSCQILQVQASGAGLSITGLQSPFAGAELVMQNIGSNSINLPHQSASSGASNRFITSTGATLALAAGAWAWFWYDVQTSRWRVTL